jgi:predicted P-loop ATPase
MTETEPSTVLQVPNVTWALNYASKGWFVFPLHSIDPKTKNCTCKREDCDRKGKHPRTKHGVDDATTDRDTIEKWFKKWPTANIGLSCGKSGIVVVDVDPRNGGDETLRQIEKAFGELPRTPMQLTGGDGLHYIFSRPDSIGPKVRGTKVGRETIAGIEVPGGVDIKADGGYIVLAPSNHQSGGTYRWDAGFHPDDVAPSSCPGWLLARLKRPTNDVQSTIGAVDGLLGAAFKAAGWAGRSLGTDRITVQCPWESEHTGGNRFDGSTIVYSPNVGKTTGHFWCAHSHCQQSRTLKDVLAVLPAAALQEARRHCSLPDGHKPPPETEPAPETDEPWTDSLRLNAEGFLMRDPGNAALLLANLPDWKGCIRYNEFSGKTEWHRPPPLLLGMAVPKVNDEIQDWHATYIGQWFSVHRRVNFPKDTILGAIDSAARASAFNPLQDYLSHLVWDGKQRIATWLSTYLGADDNEYTRITGRWWLISAIARAFKPGCQVDHVIVLRGRQGSRKSSALITLAGEKWCLESLPKIREGKDAQQILRGNWICIMSELSSIRGAAYEEAKDYVTRRTDKFRPSHGRFTIEVPRSCVFAGTTNEEYCLPPDPTGLRRWWPVSVRDALIDELERDRDQIWAEAMLAYQAGEAWWPDDEKHLLLLNGEQSESVDEDPWISVTEKWIEMRSASYPDFEFETAELLRMGIGIPPDRMTRADQTRIGSVLRVLGWEPFRVYESGGRRPRLYRRANPST